MSKLKKGDFVSYPDGLKGRVTSVTETSVSLWLVDGTTAEIHPSDAEKCLTKLEKKPRG